ncbi:MAG: HAD family phosphatase [Planctomycetota bacterium]
MLRAVIFDCDGVLVDSEPAHYEGFRRTLAESGIRLSRRDYFDRYLAYSDAAAFQHILTDQKRFTPALHRRLCRRKAVILRAILPRLRLLPGVRRFVRESAGRGRAAIASGALRGEVEAIVRHHGLAPFIHAVVGAEDVRRGKPHPDPFRRALALLNAGERGRKIRPAECLVVEDSFLGIAAAKAAGMKCLAVATSYPAAKLREADVVARSLARVRLADVEKKLFR